MSQPSETSSTPTANKATEEELNTTSSATSSAPETSTTSIQVTNGTAMSDDEAPAASSSSTPKKRKKAAIEPRKTPERSTRGVLPEYLRDDYEVGDIDLRQLMKSPSSTKKASSSSSTPKKSSTPKRKAAKPAASSSTAADSSSSDDDVSSSEEEEPKTKKRKTPVKTAGKAKKATPRATASSSTPNRARNNTPGRPNNISLTNLPSDDTTTTVARTPGNRYSEYQSSHIDYEEALRRLLAKTPGNEFKRGDVDASHWAISSSPITEFTYFDTNAIVDKTMTLQQVLAGCYYAEGNRTRVASSGQDDVPAVQICFSFDTTGSQINIIDDLKWKLQNMCTQLLEDIPSIQIALIAHGDYADASMFYVMRKLDFSNDIDQIVSFVQSLKGTGGMDPQECYEMALREAKTLSWVPKENPYTQRTLVVIGDDVPHGSDEYLKIDWKQEVSDLFNDYHIKIHSVQCQAREHANEFYQYLGDETGGRRFELKDFESMHHIMFQIAYSEATEHNMQNPDLQQHLQQSSSGIVRPSDDSGADQLTDEELMYIHESIHNPSVEHITIKGTRYDISLNDGVCRYVRIGDVTYIEQNKEKNTKYAKLALQGKKVTWFSRKGQWGLIIDDEIKIR